MTRKRTSRALMTLLPLLAACAQTPDADKTLDQNAGELSMAGFTESGAWQSAPWSGGPWISLPGISNVTVPHELDRMPTTVQVYLSFVEDDRGDRDPRTFFPAAGDVANIVKITRREVTVNNTTRGEFYMRVVLD